jgi:AAA domain/Relaxase/Mobilisation nuclease domain
MITRCIVGRGVTGAVRYILGEGRDPESGVLKPMAVEKSRVAWFGGTGFGFTIDSLEDADLARRVMEFDALNQGSRTKQCEKDCVHLALGWRPGDTPTRQEMEAAGRAALKAMGMENARAIFAAHNDESYAHLHIVASKINPETGRAYNLIGNYLKLSKWAQGYELEHGGIVCLRREDVNRLRDAISARDAGGVLAAMTEQRATFTANDLERAVAKQIRKPLQRAQFCEQVFNHAEAVKLSDEPGGLTTRFTTRTVLTAEGYVLRAADGLARNSDHDVGDNVRASVLGSTAFATMRHEQALAYHKATGSGGLALIDGQAGTGKSYTMAAIRQAYEATGCTVIGLGPTNAVAIDMQRDGFKRAATVHSELFALNNGRAAWDHRTVVMVDEAAMLDTKLMAMITAHAYQAGAKLILVGDDRQLSSIERGGMFAALKERHGAAALTEVTRQRKDDDRRASGMMADGNFHEALAMYDAKGAITWTRTQDEARVALIRRWAADTAAEPKKSHFVFAYTNADVAQLNAELREIRRWRGELGKDHVLPTTEGWRDFARGDRLQLTGTDKKAGLYNGMIGTVVDIEDTRVTIKLDGPQEQLRSFDAREFGNFRHGYAGTIYKGQGRTLDQSYLYHSEHWRKSASYVALTRHRDKAQIFVAKNTAPDVAHLARQMARVDERRAASHFYRKEDAAPVRPLTPRQLMAELGDFMRRRAPEPMPAPAQRQQQQPPPARGQEAESAPPQAAATQDRKETPPTPEVPERPEDERAQRFRAMLDRSFSRSNERDRGPSR